MNAIHAGNVDPDSAKWSVTQSMLEREIHKVKKAKAEEEEDWVSAGVIGGEIAFEGAGSSWAWAWRGDGV